MSRSHSVPPTDRFDIPTRITLAVDAVCEASPRRILEVGCGGGHALSALARRLPTATIVGIDRSATQVEKARARVSSIATAKRPEVLRLTLTAASTRWAATPFDVVVAVNVNAFWTEPAIAFPAAASLLPPGGQLLLVYEPPSAEGVRRLIARVREAAAAGGWTGAMRPDAHGACVRFFGGR